jgi:secondary thiamine-phosphate synthase enzyme
MGTYRGSFSVSSSGETDIIDITGRVQSVLRDSGLASGILTAFVSGSTAGITTIEYESGLVSDLKAAYERIAPRDGNYEHNLRWGDGNGYAHVRASLTGQAISIPFLGGKLSLGTWQQIILIDFDNRPRRREIVVHVVGEK